jgi:5-methylcytosine-specific restriction endonuclease McrA
MKHYGIPALGAQHLRKGKSATWNIGIKRTEEQKERIRKSKLGSTPPNKGKGDITFCCEICGILVTDKPYRRKRTCSQNCKNELMSTLRGAEHWNYTGDAAGFRQRIRSYVQYREWRKTVLQRDNFMCKKCKILGDNLTVHHLNSFAAFPEQRFTISNGVVLCKPCHWQFHKKYGHKLTTREMYEDWITS